MQIKYISGDAKRGFWCIKGKLECRAKGWGPISGNGPKEELVKGQKDDAELKQREGENANEMEQQIINNDNRAGRYLGSRKCCVENGLGRVGWCS